jgi:hypothetical protein
MSSAFKFLPWLVLAPTALAVECPNTTGNPYIAEVANIQRLADTTTRLIEIGNLLRIDTSASCFVQYVLLQQRLSDRARLFVQSFKDWEAARTDKQAGSTSLVSSGLTAQVLSMAAEYGAVIESASNQTVTVQGSLDGILAAAIQQNLVGYCPDGAQSPDPFCVKQPLYSWLRRFSYGVSLNASLPAITARLVLVDQRDATSKKFQDAWTKQAAKSAPEALSTAAKDLLAQLHSILGASFDKIQNQEGYSDWYNASFLKLREDAAAEPFDAATFSNDLDRSIHILYELVVTADPALPQQAADFLRGSETYAFTEQSFIESIANTPVLTIEYDDNRPQNQSSYSTVRLIYDQPLSGRLSLVANGALAGESRLRDAQLGVQLKYSLNSKAAAAVSGTYYFQYQNSPAELTVTPGTPLPGITLADLSSSATQVFAQKGNIQAGQLRLEFGPAGSSVRFPLALTYSNRTELIAKPELRAQIGISYDFDALFANATAK